MRVRVQGGLLVKFLGDQVTMWNFSSYAGKSAPLNPGLFKGNLKYYYQTLHIYKMLLLSLKSIFFHYRYQWGKGE